ncbi:hypothetical protein ACFX13_026534 [Malus domestica]
MGLGAPRQPMGLGAPRKLMGLGESWMVLQSRLAVKNLPGFLRELDGSSKPCSIEEFARLLERELDGSSEPSSSEEFDHLKRKLDGSSVLSSNEEFARLLEIDTKRSESNDSWRGILT